LAAWLPGSSGRLLEIRFREVIRLKPTLLTGSVPFAPETIAAILEQPVAFLAINPRSLVDIENDIRAPVRLMNLDTKADRLIDKMKREFTSVAQQAAKVRRRHKPIVYCEAWPNPRISSPPWVAELVDLAGGANAVSPGARVTNEEVAQAKPDLIVLAWTATGDRAKRERALRNPLWENVPGVKNGRVVVIRDELLNTPGPPSVQGAWELLRAMHPEASRTDAPRC